MKKPIIMKLIKIDAHNRKVTEEIVTFEKSEEKIQYMYKFINTDMVEGVALCGSKNMLIVDEEARLKALQPGFRLQGAHHPFLGNGVIAGLKKGEWSDTDLTVEAVQNMITWA